MVELIETSSNDYLENAASTQKLIGLLQGIQLEQLAGYAQLTEQDPFAHLEIAARLRISDRAAQDRLRFALELTTPRLPETLETLKRGAIEEFKARLLCDAVRMLTDKHARQVETSVLDKASRQTPGQVRNALTKAVLAVDPDGAEQRRQERARERRVESQPTGDGHAMLTIHHSAERIASLHGHITAQARALKAMAANNAPWPNSKPTSPAISTGSAESRCT